MNPFNNNPANSALARIAGFLRGRLDGTHPRTACRFLQSRAGVAATEFAVIAPFLLIAYLGSVELAAGIDASKKVKRSAGVVADLVTQGDNYTAAQLSEIIDIGMANIQPYNRSDPTMTIYGIEMVDTGGAVQARVAWSITKTEGSTARKAVADGTVLTDVPASLRIEGTFMVRATTQLNYKSLSLGSTEYTGDLDGLLLTDTASFRPRYIDEVTCSDCSALP